MGCLASRRAPERQLHNSRMPRKGRKRRAVFQSPGDQPPDPLPMNANVPNFRPKCNGTIHGPGGLNPSPALAVGAEKPVIVQHKPGGRIRGSGLFCAPRSAWRSVNHGRSSIHHRKLICASIASIARQRYERISPIAGRLRRNTRRNARA